MAEHCGYVVRVEKLRPHSNADKLQILTVYSTDVIVSLDVKHGDIGVFFPSDLQLGEKFCEVNDLVRRKDEKGNPCGGYLDPVKRNIKPIRLRGEKSDGLYLPLSCLSSFCNISQLTPGDTITVIGGETICQKYIPADNGSGRTRRASGKQNSGNRVSAICPQFKEHVETEQLVYHLPDFHEGDDIEITLKMHGTSQRTGYLPVTKTKRPGWFRRLFHLPPVTHTAYEYITGTRRVVLAERKNPGLYESDEWRYAMEGKFIGQLHEGETVYYEVVGFQGQSGAPIMASANNRVTKNDEFIKQYGEQTVFSYGCDPTGNYLDFCGYDGGLIPSKPCCDVYVYRMTMTSPDGYVVEYSPEQIHQRCEQMGVKYVVEFDRFRIPKGTFDPGVYVKAKAEQYFDGRDPVGITHIREGVVVRIVNRPGFVVYKHKNFSFKLIEGIVKDNAVAPDMEEAQELPGGDAT